MNWFANYPADDFNLLFISTVAVSSHSFSLLILLPYLYLSYIYTILYVGLADALAGGFLLHINEVLVATTCFSAIAVLCEGDPKTRYDSMIIRLCCCMNLQLYLCMTLRLYASTSLYILLYLYMTECKHVFICSGCMTVPLYIYCCISIWQYVSMCLYDFMTVWQYLSIYIAVSLYDSM